MVQRPQGLPSIDTGTILGMEKSSPAASSNAAGAPKFQTSRFQQRAASRGMNGIRNRGNYTSRFKYQSRINGTANKEYLRTGLPQSRDPSPDKRTTGNEEQYREKESTRVLPTAGQGKTEELVCDYDTSATLLYRLLEASKWEEAKRRARSHPEEVQTWIMRRDKKTLRTRWRLLPLHACIIFQAPSELISLMVDKYPEGVKCQDDQGMLPLHLLFRHKRTSDSDLLNILLTRYEKGVAVKDNKGRLPIDHARDCKLSLSFVKAYTRSFSALLSSPSKMSSLRHPVSPVTNTTAPTISLAEEERNQIEAKYEVHLMALRQGHLVEMKKLKEKHTGELEMARHQSTIEIQAVKEASNQEKKRLQRKHAEEMDELRDLLSQRVEKDKELVDTLEAEVVRLQRKVKEESTERKYLDDQYKSLQLYSRDLQNQLDKIVVDHQRIQDMAKEQQTELTSSRRKRSQLVQSLLQLEESCRDNEISKNTMLELAESVQARIDKMMEDEERKVERPPMISRAFQHKSQLPNRLEIERYRGGSSASTFNKHHYTSSPREMSRAPTVDIGFDGADLDHAFEAAHALGDEISAITEGSPFWGR